MDNQYIIVNCTCPNREVAERIANALVDEGLAACVNILPEIISVYRWQGERHNDREWLLSAKSRDDAFAQLEARIRALHPYDIAEIIALPIHQGTADYLAWVDANVGRPR